MFQFTKSGTIVRDSKENLTNVANIDGRNMFHIDSLRSIMLILHANSNNQTSTGLQTTRSSATFYILKYKFPFTNL